MPFLSFLGQINPWRLDTRPEQTFKRVALQQVSPPEAIPLTSDLPDTPPALIASTFARDEVDAFLHFGQWLDTPQSSNVASIQYDADRSYLTIKFDPKAPAAMKAGGSRSSRGPAYYGYEGVSIREAEHFARAGSKGRWVWDHLRVRGKGNFWGWRKPYQLLSGLSDYTPQWMRNKKARLLHGSIGPEGLRDKKLARILMPRGTRT